MTVRFQGAILFLGKESMAISGEIGGTYQKYVWCFRPMFQGISLQNMALYGMVPPFWDPEIPGNSLGTLEKEHAHLHIFNGNCFQEKDM